MALERRVRRRVGRYGYGYRRVVGDRVRRVVVAVVDQQRAAGDGGRTGHAGFRSGTRTRNGAGRERFLTGCIDGQNACRAGHGPRRAGRSLGADAQRSGGEECGGTSGRASGRGSGCHDARSAGWQRDGRGRSDDGRRTEEADAEEIAVRAAGDGRHVSESNSRRKDKGQHHDAPGEPALCG